MKFLLINKINGDQKVIDYPRNDKNPIVGLAENLEIFVISDEILPYDNRLHNIQCTGYTLTESYDQEYTHLKIANSNWIIKEKLTNEIINNLNRSLGEYLDDNYPEWERSKHAGESLRFVVKGQPNWTENDIKRISYIQATADWCRSCRLLRDQRELDLIIDNILPSFDWIERPNKSLLL